MRRDIFLSLLSINSSRVIFNRHCDHAAAATAAPMETETERVESRHMLNDVV